MLSMQCSVLVYLTNGGGKVVCRKSGECMLSCSLLKSFVLLTLMYFVAAYLVPDIGIKDPVLSGGR